MKELFSFHTVHNKIILISKIAGAVLIASYIVSIQLPVGQEVSYLIWIAVVIFIILVIYALLKHFISNPVSRICEAAYRMAHLDFSSPCEINTGDEFGELAENLNKMSENLQQALAKLALANTRLEKDVQQKRQLLDERKELTDRLSHEMKTPLGVIRAYAEGLQDEADEEKRRAYSEIILSETERMNTLITTLLDLSALESGAVSLNPERFDFVELLETIAGRLLIDVPETDFELQYELPEHGVLVFADKPRMEQALNNLIVNAKKNVSPNGILKLSLTEQDGLLHVSIFNQGHSVPLDALPKIWEKFYRGKNAKNGGSGLGLAIVAQILTMHGFKYGAENTGDGVAFFFSLPVIPGT